MWRRWKRSRRRGHRGGAWGRRQRHAQRRLRVGLVAGAAAFGLAVVAGALLGFDDVRSIRFNLNSARNTLQQAIDSPGALRTPEGRAATIQGIETARGSIQVASRKAVGSLPIRGAGLLPGLRAQRKGLLQLIADAGSAADAGHALLAKVDSLAARNQLQDGLVPLDAARELGADLRATGAVFDRLVRSDDGLWGPLADGRRRLDELARDGAGRLVDGADAVGAALTFAGANGDRRYFVAVLNNAEMRDQGAVLQFVITKFTGSRLSFDGSGSVGELALDRPTQTTLPAGTQTVFGPIRPTQVWQSVNATADFAFSGRAMADMYLQATGQSVDGVIAIDVPGLAALLRVVGPVTVAGIPAPIDAENVGRVLLHDLYQGVPWSGDQSGRRERLGDVTRAVIERLTTGARDAVALGRELGDAAAGGHLRLWSAMPAEEDVFERTRLGGGPAVAMADRTFHLAVQNRTATKLDYFVKPTVRLDVRLTESGDAVVRTVVTLDNQAPAGQTAPSYQLGPDQFTGKPGDYLAWVLLWGPAGSLQTSGGVEESGLNLSQRIVDVAAAQQREVVFETVIPEAVRDGELQLRLVPQPRLEPVPTQVVLSTDGWRVSGERTWTGALDDVQTLRWRVRR